MAFVIIVCITVFFHRGLTHMAVKFKRSILVSGILVAFAAWEGAWEKWVATHRKHHHFSDKEGDPHSPHLHGEGISGMILGLIHAHFWWFFKEPEPDYERYIPDLLKDKPLVALDQWFLPVAIFSLILPGLIELTFIHTWKGFWMGVLWGGFGRMFFVHHMTWTVNSFCHYWGTRPFHAHDESTNIAILGFLSGGEACHRNHHAFRWSARIGLRWWEIDPGWYLIKILAGMGLAYDIKVPTPEQIERARIKRAA